MKRRRPRRGAPQKQVIVLRVGDGAPLLEGSPGTPENPVVLVGGDVLNTKELIAACGRAWSIKRAEEMWRAVETVLDGIGGDMARAHEALDVAAWHDIAIEKFREAYDALVLLDDAGDDIVATVKIIERLKARLAALEPRPRGRSRRINRADLSERAAIKLDAIYCKYAIEPDDMDSLHRFLVTALRPVGLTVPAILDSDDKPTKPFGRAIVRARQISRRRPSAE